MYYDTCLILSKDFHFQIALSGAEYIILCMFVYKYVVNYSISRILWRTTHRIDGRKSLQDPPTIYGQNAYVSCKD